MLLISALVEKVGARFAGLLSQVEPSGFLLFFAIVLSLGALVILIVSVIEGGNALWSVIISFFLLWPAALFLAQSPEYAEWRMEIVSLLQGVVLRDFTVVALLQSTSVNAIIKMVESVVTTLG